MLPVLYTTQETSFAMNSLQQLRLMSYNSTGFNSQRCDFIANKLLPASDILCVQESWHIPGGESKFSKFAGFHYFAVSGTDISDGPLLGRPHGGVVMFYRKSISKLIEFIPTCSKRICAVRVESSGCSAVLVNCYMPCDTRSDRSVGLDTQSVWN